MKKILCLILICILALPLSGCKQNKYYEPVESTEEEAAIVMTFTIGEDSYGVRYELYRALFLGNKAIVDGGDSSVWSGDNAEEYVERINEIICERAYEIYSAIHIAKSIGFDPYSDDVELKIKETVKGAVEGDSIQMGHGSYEAYLASLKESGLNYSVAALLMRYSLCIEKINEYYAGYEHEAFGQMQGDYTYTNDDVKSYYLSDECRRVMQVYLPEGLRTRSWVDSFRGELLAKSSEHDMAVHIITYTAATEADLLVGGEISGSIIGRDALDSFFYKDYIDTVFTTEPGAMSEGVEIDNTDADGYYVVYGLEKSEEHFERCYEQVRLSYIDNVIGAVIADVTDAFRASTSYGEVYSTIIHSEITID